MEVCKVNKNMKFRAIGIAVLFVLAMSAVSTSADERLDPAVPASESCTLTLDETECESDQWTYDGSAPALELGVAAMGTYTVMIASCCPMFYYVMYTFEVNLIDVEHVDTEFGIFGAPQAGWPVTTYASTEDGLALVSVTATSD